MTSLEEREGRKRMISTTSSESESGVVSARKKSRMAGFSGSVGKPPIAKPLTIEVVYLLLFLKFLQCFLCNLSDFYSCRFLLRWFIHNIEKTGSSFFCCE